MNIGIKFKIINEYGNYLKKIFNNINNSNYIWKIEEDEIYVSDTKKIMDFYFLKKKIY